MEEKYVEFKNLAPSYSGHKTRVVSEWEYTIIHGDEDFGGRFYWSAMEDDNGFEAFYVEDEGVCDDGEYREHLLTVTVQVHALWDGVRHMYFNSGSDWTGYLNYPDINGMIKVMQLIKELEIKYCSGVEE
jgi:hypothetical protein